MWWNWIELNWKEENCVKIIKRKKRTITTWKLKRRKVYQIWKFLLTLPLQNFFVVLYESIPSSQIRILQNNGKLLQWQIFLLEWLSLFLLLLLVVQVHFSIFPFSNVEVIALTHSNTKGQWCLSSKYEPYMPRIIGEGKSIRNSSDDGKEMLQYYFISLFDISSKNLI